MKPKLKTGSPFIDRDIRAIEMQFYIAQQIILFRQAEGLSQEKLAKKLGVSQANVARMESGQQNFTIGTLIQMAKVFNKSLTVEFFD